MKMLWQIYLRKGTVFIPTVAVTKAGFFMDIEPVNIVDKKNCQAIINALKMTILKGNPVIETPTRASFPKPVILNHAGVRSWISFEKQATCWKILKDDSTFQLCPQKKNPFGGWEDNEIQKETFDSESAIDEIAMTVARKIQSWV